ncbi:uncharacterized protein STEHIDRAFT_168985 [Stereum hirsutum FP-91666 SS1]|uniref:uncharacterized protein n=1 Tax=Stereum hirsutum (strain FP-91666) TaxID=721885 RepID=UPI000444A43E|nr:uncharacterized protein STEHIDRAFT_168985 [Stereum hirsutum FP-91666 SS1]EIM85958.1 hypothetical protein STEHIDRAFT_168985 [Stereum hirsutum FP-91666 SS1]
MGLLELPHDLLVLVVRHLDVPQLAALSQTCSSLHALVDDYGWPHLARHTSRPSHSLSKALSSWPPYEQLKYSVLTDHAWRKNKFAARPLSRPWHGKLQPLLAINPSRLFVAAGHIIYAYLFVPSPVAGVAPHVKFECSYSLSAGPPHDPRRDITAIAVAPDGGLDRTLFVGFEHGALQRIFLPAVNKIGSREVYIDSEYKTPYDYHEGELVESLSLSGDLLLSLSSSGTAGLLSLSSPPSTTNPDLIDLGSRGWSSYLSPTTGNAKPSYAAFGLSSTNPLIIHPVLSSTISVSPSAILSSSSKERDATGERRPSAVYAICGTPPAFPWGASDRIVVSGWYDGFVHVHDLRSDRRGSSSSHSSSHSSSSHSHSHSHSSSSEAGSEVNPAPLLPSLSLSDPWSFEPIYALATGGGSSSQIAAGSARHSVIAFWDVRSFRTSSPSTSTSYTTPSPSTSTPGFTTSTSTSYGLGGAVGSSHDRHIPPSSGWSVHAPSNDPSPVYSLILESSRVFGATQSRPFVFDFGPGVGRGTYPALELEVDGGLGGVGGAGGGGVGGGAGEGEAVFCGGGLGEVGGGEGTRMGRGMGMRG